MYWNMRYLFDAILGTCEHTRDFSGISVIQSLSDKVGDFWFTSFTNLPTVFIIHDAMKHCYTT